MDELLNGKSIKADFEAQVTAALMNEGRTKGTHLLLKQGRVC